MQAVHGTIRTLRGVAESIRQSAIGEMEVKMISKQKGSASLVLAAALALLGPGTTGCGDCEALVVEVAEVECSLGQCLGFGSRACLTPEELQETMASCGESGGAKSGDLEERADVATGQLQICLANPPPES